MEQFEKLKHKTILVVEDEMIIRKNIASMLKYFFKEVYTAIDGFDGLDKYELYLPDIVMTDLKMPKMGGFELLKEIKNRKSSAYTVIVSAHTDTNFLINAIHNNIDRYLIKPLDEEQLFKTFEAYLEKIEKTVPHIIELENIIIDLDKHILQINNRHYSLSKKEVLFLKLLSSNSKKIFSYNEIEYQVWGEKSMSFPALRTLVRDLRNKLGEEFIINVSKIGYRFHI